jgi:hypothetical protein
MATATELAAELHSIRSEIAALKLREQDVEDRLAAEMPEKRLEVPGLGVFDDTLHRHGSNGSTMIYGVRS